MENRKKLNPNPVPFNIFGERLRVFFDEDRIRIMGTDAAEILGFANAMPLQGTAPTESRIP